MIQKYDGQLVVISGSVRITEIYWTYLEHHSLRERRNHLEPGLRTPLEQGLHTPRAFLALEAGRGKQIKLKRKSIVVIIGTITDYDSHTQSNSDILKLIRN